MVNKCKPDWNELEWAVFLFNTMGEDNLYFVDLYKVQKAMDNGTPGEAIVDFLNHWSMRATKKPLARAIDKWYTDEVARKLKYLPETLIEADLVDKKVIMGELYRYQPRNLKNP